MDQLSQFSDLIIDWDMTPEDAVVLYLEWGNNDWHGKHQPVRSKDDYTNYFIIDNWRDEPRLLLIHRNSEKAEELLDVELPPQLAKQFREEFGRLKGVFEPTDEIKAWLKEKLYH